jgi:hypothetical protein
MLDITILSDLDLFIFKTLTIYLIKRAQTLKQLRRITKAIKIPKMYQRADMSHFLKHHLKPSNSIKTGLTNSGNI